MTHTSTEQAEALQIAEQLRAEWKSDALNYDTALEAADELERQHARILELEAVQSQRAPLTDEAIRTLYGESDGHWQMVGPQVLCFARSIESVHGITQEKQG